MTPRPLTPEQVAEHFGCSANHIRNLIKNGELGAFQLGRLWRVPQAAIDEYQARNVEREQDRSHHRVYFIRCGDYVKIGVTGNIEGRLKALQTANALLLELLTHIPGSYEDEHRLHAQFAALHHRDEWFRYEAELREYVERATRG